MGRRAYVAAGIAGASIAVAHAIAGLREVGGPRHVAPIRDIGDP